MPTTAKSVKNLKPKPKRERIEDLLLQMNKKIEVLQQEIKKLSSSEKKKGVYVYKFDLFHIYGDVRKKLISEFTKIGAIMDKFQDNIFINSDIVFLVNDIVYQDNYNKVIVTERYFKIVDNVQMIELKLITKYK